MKKLYQKMDKPLLIIMLLFTIFGLVMVFSASSITAVLYNKVEESYFFKRQLLVALVMWLAGIFFIVRIPTSKYKVLARIGIVGIIGALLFVYSYGTIVNSARSWIYIGPFNFQPSEFFKTIMILYLAVSFEKLITHKENNTLKLLLPFIISIIGVFLIAIEPDLGTAVIAMGIIAAIFIYLPIKTKTFKVTKISFVIALALVGLFIIFSGNFLTREQTDRLNYKEPCTRYSQKTGYQVCNGFIAISNGGLFGVGLGNSTQKYLYLPEAYTDFIFPIIIEELGAIGGIIVIIGYIVLLFRLLKIAKIASTIRGKIIAFGSFAYIIIHLAVNFLGIMALIPLTGVPVPFLSYGGSFLVNILFILFVNQRVVIESKTSEERKLIKSI